MKASYRIERLVYASCRRERETLAFAPKTKNTFLPAAEYTETPRR
jgi:hypothetical protein